MKAIKIKDLKKGEYFTFKPAEEPNENKVWVRDEYNRCTRRYEVYRWNNVCHFHELKGDRIVYTDFIF